MAFWTYMLKCSDGRFYVGHTDNLESRLGQHQSGVYRGYTLHRRPVELVWAEYFQTRYEALVVERQIKGWSKAKKVALIAGDWEKVSELARSKSCASRPSTSSGRTETGEVE